MKEAAKKLLTKAGLVEPTRRVYRAAQSAYRELRGSDRARDETSVAVRRDDREIWLNAGCAASAALPATIEFFDYIHSAVVPQWVNGVAIANFTRLATHRLTQSGAEVELSFDKDFLAVRKGNRELRLNPSHITYVWDVANVLFEHDYSAVVPEMKDGIAVVDYSAPRVHRMARSGLEFEFPSFAESDESAEAYLHFFEPQRGEVILDVGAYAGASAYVLSQAVGAEGVVACFEPDETNFHCLERNIARHHLGNTIAFHKGVWSETTTLAFQSEGNMGSALVSVLGRKTHAKMVEVVSLSDAAALTGRERVAAVKLDVEGAELAILRAAGDFLSRHRPRLVIEPHVVAGKMSTDEICQILASFNYATEVVSQGVQDWPLVAARPR